MNIVQQNGTTTPDITGEPTSISHSMSSLPSVGNLIVVVYVANSETNNEDPVITDNQGNTYTQQGTITGTGRISIWTAPVTTASGTFTISGAFSLNQFGLTDARIYAYELTGWLSIAEYQEAGPTTDNAPTVNMAAVAQEAIVIGAFVQLFTGAGGFVPGNGFTQDDEDVVSNPIHIIMSQYFAGASSATDPTAATDEFPQEWIGAGLTILGTTGPVTPPTLRWMRKCPVVRWR